MTTLITNFAISFLSSFLITGWVTLILMTAFVPLLPALIIANLCAGFWTVLLVDYVIAKADHDEIPF
jgi:hypothetical protein